jgi:hypothetical protein
MEQELNDLTDQAQLFKNNFERLVEQNLEDSKFFKEELQKAKNNPNYNLDMLENFFKFVSTIKQMDDK